MREVDLVIEVGAILPMASETILYDGLLAIDSGRIIYVGDARSGRADFSGRQTIREPDCVALPGLVNAHAHVGAYAFGTLCEAVPNAITTLYDLWLPLAGRYDEEIMEASASLGVWDAVQNGVTTLVNDEFFPEAIARAVAKVGARAVIANIITEYPPQAAPKYDHATRTYELTSDRSEAERGLASNVEFVERWRDHSLVVPCIGPHAPDTLSTESLKECAAAAESLDCRLLIHVAQSEAEVAKVREKGYRGSIHYLSEIGFLSPRVQGAHMAHLDEEEVRIARDSGMGMSWTPIPMMTTHAYAKIDHFHGSPMRLGLGTDGFAMDLLEEMRYAFHTSHFIRGEAKDAASSFEMTPFELLSIATVGGARCAGLENEIGTLEVGKKADVIILNFADPHLTATFNHFEAIVLHAKARHVTHTIVDGKVVCVRGELQLADGREILRNGREASKTWLLEKSRDILERTGAIERFEPHFLGGTEAMLDQDDQAVQHRQGH